VKGSELYRMLATLGNAENTRNSRNFDDWSREQYKLVMRNMKIGAGNFECLF
jgi:ABC-type sulfate transport system substrate-binding protein